ncbi:unnamed protein product [Closterium sp. Naga37s-1]|nr:unnamed protein product [Closterium sp. Naga37s-1]
MRDFYLDLMEDGRVITPRDYLGFYLDHTEDCRFCLSLLTPSPHHNLLPPLRPPSPQDFYLDLTEDGRVITPRYYLETALQSVAEGSDSARAKNQVGCGWVWWGAVGWAIRESIRSLFPDRDCFSLVRPIIDERLLQKLDTLPVSAGVCLRATGRPISGERLLQKLDLLPRDQLRPEFTQGLDVFTQAVFARARPKRVGGTVMTGSMLAGLTQTYIEALNNGAVPTILNSWLSMEETECRTAFKAALEEYTRAFGNPTSADAVGFVAGLDGTPSHSVLSLCPLTPSYHSGDLVTHHNAALLAAETAFREELAGEGRARHKYEEKLREEAGKRFEAVLKRGAPEAELRCKRYLEAVEAKVRGLARGPPRAATADAVRTLIAELVEYESSMSGSAKWRCLSEFLISSFPFLPTQHVWPCAGLETADIRS